MALVAAEHDPSSRRRVYAVHVQHAVAGALVLIGATVLRHDEPARVIADLGPSGPLLVILFFFFATILALLKFKLTEEIFVSLAVTAFFAMFPLLGMVISAWIAVASSMVPRLLGALQIGPAKIDTRDAAFETARTFGLFSIYGIPLIVAVSAYELLGGAIPTLEPSGAAAARIAACSVLLVFTNNLIVSRIELAYGYSNPTLIKTAALDHSIYIVTIPYAILTTFAYGSIGWAGVLASAFTWVIANYVARSLATTRADREQLIQRLTSLTNIGKTISLNCSTDELLMKIYTECRGVIDVSIFSIALYDSSTDELAFELNIDHGALQPKERLAVGGGLNSWVFRNARPLLIGSSLDERKLGVHSYDDGLATQSWLGVPMIARDHVIGVISVQSFEKHIFTHGDLVLLTAIANQAAAAIENAQLYKDLEGLNVALEHRVQERTVELRDANLALLAADRSKNQFLASMSHELRTPLNAIIGFSSILQTASQTMLTPRLFKFVENIKTAGSHLLDLINDILDLAKIEAGKLEIEPVSFDLNETIATVDRVIKGMAAERDVTLVTRVDGGIGNVYMDEGRVKQILLNLLSNAIKFSHKGGFIYLTVNAVADTLSPLGCETVRIEVTDTGIGIPPAELARIFDEFYQVAERGRKGGTGLGLSLTRNFVELHHGSIEVRSEPDQGSTFTIHLPRFYRDAPPQMSAMVSQPRVEM
ncbi:MAG TPA: ATP-binding protein [Thermoanaerobaculia bacterium]|nr:ATP-binding protein [Thermoanaerobaculia bacterium]